MKFQVKVMAISAVALFAPLAAMSADTKAKGEAKADKTAAVCQQATGSRIKPRDTTNCAKSTSQPFRSYSAEQLQQTGEMDLAQALRNLDPSFR